MAKFMKRTTLDRVKFANSRSISSAENNLSNSRNGTVFPDFACQQTRPNV